MHRPRRSTSIRSWCTKRTKRSNPTAPPEPQTRNYYWPQSRARLKPETMTVRSEEHTSELQSRLHLVCRLLLEKKKKKKRKHNNTNTKHTVDEKCVISQTHVNDT